MNKIIRKEGLEQFSLTWRGVQLRRIVSRPKYGSRQARVPNFASGTNLCHLDQTRQTEALPGNQRAHYLRRLFELCHRSSCRIAWMLNPGQIRFLLGDQLRSMESAHQLHNTVVGWKHKNYRRPVRFSKPIPLSYGLMSP